MKNHYIFLISLCVLSGQLMSMQKSCIKTAGELKTLAFAVEPRDYVTTLEKYTVKPSAVSQSLSVLLDSSHYLADGMSKHVETTCEYNDDTFKKQVIEIMQEYRARQMGHISFSDKIKIEIYQELAKKQSGIDNEISRLRGYFQLHLTGILFGGAFGGLLGVLDIVLLVAGRKNC